MWYFLRPGSWHTKQLLLNPHQIPHTNYLKTQNDQFRFHKNKQMNINYQDHL